jgi:hypothetical protein
LGGHYQAIEPIHRSDQRIERLIHGLERIRETAQDLGWFLCVAGSLAAALGRVHAALA